MVGDETKVWWQETESGDHQRSDNEEFEAFVSAVQDYTIFKLDPDGTLVSWNEGAKRIKGYMESEIVGEHFSMFYTAENIEASVPERNLEAAAKEDQIKDEGWRVRKDGSQFWGNVTITAVRDDDGTLQGFTKVTRDLTEQREYEQQLKQERDLTKYLFETVPVSISVLDEDGQFVRVNQRMLARSGIDEPAID